jgi:hypothetical protein
MTDMTDMTDMTYKTTRVHFEHTDCPVGEFLYPQPDYQGTVYFDVYRPNSHTKTTLVFKREELVIYSKTDRTIMYLYRRTK